jgi:ADP-L-glycero-D-manno-heptose 6-epimerase
MLMADVLAFIPAAMPQGTIVVTGAAGMIGSQILRALADSGNRLVACDPVPRYVRGDYSRGIAIHRWLGPDGLLEWLDGHADEVAAVIHMGAISDTTETRLDLLQKNNVDFTMALWRRACRHDWRFLYASSAATYGAGEHGFADRDDADYLGQLAPLNPYGRSKHDTDRLIVEQWRSDEGPLPTVWAGFKFFNVYGPNEEHKGEMRSLVRKIVPLIRAGETVRLFRSHRPDFADGGQMRDFIHVADAVRAVLHGLTQPSLGGLFNVGTGTARSFADLALATYAALDTAPRIDYIDMPQTIREQYQYHTCADTAKSCAAGLQDVRFTLESGIADYVASLTHSLAEQA